MSTLGTMSLCWKASLLSLSPLIATCYRFNYWQARDPTVQRRNYFRMCTTLQPHETGTEPGDKNQPADEVEDEENFGIPLPIEGDSRQTQIRPSLPRRRSVAIISYISIRLHVANCNPRDYCLVMLHIMTLISLIAAAAPTMHDALCTYSTRIILAYVISQ